jgi:hypothetical protein
MLFVNLLQQVRVGILFANLLQQVRELEYCLRICYNKSEYCL